MSIKGVLDELNDSYRKDAVLCLQSAATLLENEPDEYDFEEALADVETAKKLIYILM